MRQNNKMIIEDLMKNQNYQSEKFSKFSSEYSIVLENIILKRTNKRMKKRKKNILNVEAPEKLPEIKDFEQQTDQWAI